MSVLCSGQSHPQKQIKAGYTAKADTSHHICRWSFPVVTSSEHNTSGWVSSVCHSHTKRQRIRGCSSSHAGCTGCSCRRRRSVHNIKWRTVVKEKGLLIKCLVGTDWGPVLWCFYFTTDYIRNVLTIWLARPSQPLTPWAEGVVSLLRKLRPRPFPLGTTSQILRCM